MHASSQQGSTKVTSRSGPHRAGSTFGVGSSSIGRGCGSTRSTVPTVLVVDDHDELRDLVGTAADAVVTRRTDVALAVHTADCASVGFVSADGMIGAAHAGWRGLVDGVLDAAVEAMRGQGATGIRAVLGPCIGVECYEFGEADLRTAVGVLGPEVAGQTPSGTPALDLRRGVEVALTDLGVPIVARDPRCTSCGGPSSDSVPAHFSHRARREAGRQALVVWSEAVTSP